MGLAKETQWAVAREEAIVNFVQSKEYAVNTAPEDEIEGCAVPESTEQHGDEQIDVLTELAVTVSAKADVEVVLQPGREADVPTPPEFCDAGRFVGGIEVLRKAESEQQGYTDGHVGVARKVAIDLKCVAIDSKQVLQT